ncbi:hypothetical protein WA1_18865 [Scytonema hofmannii PCC 7110]|uniref:Calx-beta domain-containing protein n=1 Tax=Scytonema hofmannii PCC 7110 TaxID=128403 RepID=A0A139XBK3_9CYAN|nr:hypothetical protein [Scytonema hofmannii]KYC42065.1 hypothetical protein WA1_18865 [Scytonema hofmannii PCC 7110]
MRATIFRESSSGSVNNSKFTRGDTENIKVRLVGQSLVAANFSFTFTAKINPSDPDGDAIIQKTSATNGGITVASVASNMLEATIAIASTDTEILKQDDELFYDIQMKTTTPVSVRTLEKGKFFIEADVTQTN